MNVDTTTGSLGVLIDYRWETSWGVFAPRFRVEHQYDFKNDATAVIRYADLIGTSYRADVVGFDRNRTSIGLGALFSAHHDWSFRIEYRGLVGGSDRDNSLLLSVERKY